MILICIMVAILGSYYIYETSKYEKSQYTAMLIFKSALMDTKTENCILLKECQSSK